MGIRSLPLISFSLHPKSSVHHRSHLPASSAARPAPRAQWDSDAADLDARSGFRTRQKLRKWWSEEDEEEDDDDDQGLFRLWQDPKTIDFALKVLGAVGWIMPNIIMSSMLDTGDKGQDALFMALMLPLGQFAISLVVDKIQGSSKNTRRKRKKNPFARTASKTRQGDKTRKRSYRSNQERAAFHPWWDSSFSSNGSKSSSNFGGWDELDQQVDNVSGFHVLSPREGEKLKKDSKVQIE